MTDNEIVKALECCGKLHIENIDSFCNECIFKGKAMCIGYLCDNSIDLINRLQEENERLEKENSTFAKRFYKEGAKDFAKRLKQEMQEWNYDFVSKPLKRMALSEVDNLLKEMVGEDK